MFPFHSVRPYLDPIWNTLLLDDTFKVFSRTGRQAQKVQGCDGLGILKKKFKSAFKMPRAIVMVKEC